jgi:hypothetical protein
MNKSSGKRFFFRRDHSSDVSDRNISHHLMRQINESVQRETQLGRERQIADQIARESAELTLIEKQLKQHK